MRPLLGLFLLAPALLHAAQFEVLDIPGVILRDNPLGDPPARRLAVYLPDGSQADRALPLVIYLPGWGGSSEDAIAQGAGAWFGAVVDRLTEGHLPARIAVVDGRSRYGGSQFLNSGATGNYADYVADEILPTLVKRYATSRDGVIIAGHSSGAYGALWLAMHRGAQFGAVVALSPDSDFEVTHRPLVQQPSVRAVTRADLDAATAAQNPRLPTDGLARLVMGLCANYAPLPDQPRRFAWLYDEHGAWQPEAWQRWLDLDPLTQVRDHPTAFLPTQRVYLDGAEHDEFGANIGARKIFEILRTRPAAVTFDEPPGGHGEHLPDRLFRGLRWVSEKP